MPLPLPDDELPDIFLTATPDMIKNFKRFGENQFMTFDVTYNIVKDIKR